MYRQIISRNARITNIALFNQLLCIVRNIESTELNGYDVDDGGSALFSNIVGNIFLSGVCLIIIISTIINIVTILLLNIVISLEMGVFSSA